MVDEYRHDEDYDYDPDPIYLDEDEDRGEKQSANVAPAKRGSRTFMSATEDGEGVEITVDDEKQWYVIHCYSGYENKVRHAIEQRTETMGMEDKIFEVIVPTEEQMEIKDGKRKIV